MQPDHRYIVVSEEFPPKDGGVAQFAEGLTRALHAARPETVLFARRDARGGPIRELPGVPTFPLDGARWKLLRHLHMIRHAGRMQAQVQPDRPGTILALNWKLALLPLSVFGRGPTLRVVIFAHGADVLYPTGAAKKAMLRRAFTRADRGIAVSAYLARRLVERGAPESRVSALHPGVDAAPFERNESELDRVTRRLDLKGRRVLLTVARLDLGKGHEEVLRVLPAVLERHPRALYLVAGDGPLRSRLVSLAREIGIADHVRFLGSVTPGSPELAALYHACDLFVMANRPYRTRNGATAEEAAGIVFLEAGVCGKPVIAGDSGGSPELVEEGRTGYVIDGTDASRLGAALNHLLDDPVLARTLGENGRRRVLTHYSWEAVADRLLGLLET